MNELIADLRPMPIRVRVAIGASCADASLVAISKYGYLQKPACKALDVAWTWVEGGNTSARRIYNQIEPISLLMQENDDLPQALLAPLKSVAYALYFTAWHARGIELKTNDPKYDRPLPNDIRDVTERTLGDCLREAAVALGDCEWAVLVDRIRSRIAAITSPGPEELGEPVGRLWLSP